MSKERSPAFQHYPKDMLSDFNYLSMTWEQRGILRHLMDLCWLEGPIPDDVKLLARILNMPEEEFKGAWQMVGKCFQANPENAAQLIHPELERQRQIQREWRDKSAKGGRRSAHKRKQTKANPAQQGGSMLVDECLQPNGKQRSTLQSAVCYIESAVSSSLSAVSSPQSVPAEKDSAAQQASPRGDDAYELFCSEFLEYRKVPYHRSQKKDFIKLAGLREQLGLTGKATPENWLQAIRNYFNSPLNQYTLADLCNRFDVFLNSSLDRFGKPISEESYGGRRVDGFGGPELDEETIAAMEEDKRRAEEAARANHPGGAP
jgi:uncharacterized protein YdaU (DUF1376 family)